jgi:hypothetical protein
VDLCRGKGMAASEDDLKGMAANEDDVKGTAGSEDDMKVVELKNMSEALEEELFDFDAPQEEQQSVARRRLNRMKRLDIVDKKDQRPHPREDTAVIENIETNKKGEDGNIKEVDDEEDGEEYWDEEDELLDSNANEGSADEKEEAADGNEDDEGALEDDATFIPFIRCFHPSISKSLSISNACMSPISIFQIHCIHHTCCAHHVLHHT